MSLKNKLKIGITGLSLLIGLNTARAQQIYGQVTDVITGLGIPNIEVVNEGIDSTFTDLNGNYILDVVYVPPVQVHPQAGRPIRMPGTDIFNIKGEKLGSLRENQTLEDFLNNNNIANGVYFIKTDPKINNNILYTGKALKIGTDIHWCGPQSLKSYDVSSSKSSLRTLDDNYFINLSFKDEDDTTSTGDYFDIERDSLEVNGSLEQNEEMVPTKIVSISNPLDTTFVDWNYFMNVIGIPVGQTVQMDNNWKTLGYDSVGVYIPPTPQQAYIDLHQAALNSVQGIMEIDSYDGYNTLVRDLNRANNYPLFHIVEDCTWVVDNGGVYFVFEDMQQGIGMMNPIRGPPSPLKEITIDLYLGPMLSGEKTSAHELGHCLNYTEIPTFLYPWSIMNGAFTGQNYYIDEQTAAVTAILHNYGLPYFGIVNN